jgi:hypothetical protein
VIFTSVRLLPGRGTGNVTGHILMQPHCIVNPFLPPDTGSRSADHHGRAQVPAQRAAHDHLQRVDAMAKSSLPWGFPIREGGQGKPGQRVAVDPMNTLKKASRSLT